MIARLPNVDVMASVRAGGERSYFSGHAHSDNPYDRNTHPEHHLAWSQGHDRARDNQNLVRAQIRA